MAVRRPADNPFRVSQLQQLRFRAGPATSHALRSRLEQLQFRGEIVGPHGMGKSTLLRELAAHLQSNGFEIEWMQLTQDSPKPPPEAWRQIRRAAIKGALRSERIFLIDGAELLSWWRRWILRTASGSLRGLVVTTHHPLWLPPLIELAPSADRLEALVAELIEPPESVVKWQRLARKLFDQHAGNSHVIFGELYDRWANEEL